MNVNERVARYLAAMPPAISGNRGQDQTFKVACALVHGWAIPPRCALTWLRIYNERCLPKWDLQELVHKLEGAISADHVKPRGHLFGIEGFNGSTAFEVPPKAAPQFDWEAFGRFVAGHAPVEADWLAARSPIAPGSQSPATFLHALFSEGERVIIFDELRSQGQAIWRRSGLRYDANSLNRFVMGARSGVWFLCNPVDGVWRPNSEGKWSLRSQENVTAWRYMVVESDRDDISAGQWLTALVKLPLHVAAIVETGGRLPHVLLRVDAPSKERWDEIRDAFRPLLIMIGADPNSLSAVRLTRLAGCERLGKEDKKGCYHKFDDGPHLQRLLYLNPRPDGIPITQAPVVSENERNARKEGQSSV